MLLLELMSSSKLEETIELLSRKLLDIAAIKGFSDRRIMEINKSLGLYMHRYHEIKKQSNC